MAYIVYPIKEEFSNILILVFQTYFSYVSFSYVCEIGTKTKHNADTSLLNGKGVQFIYMIYGLRRGLLG